jgi:hypothetical protein
MIAVLGIMYRTVQMDNTIPIGRTADTAHPRFALPSMCKGCKMIFMIPSNRRNAIHR